MNELKRVAFGAVLLSVKLENGCITWRSDAAVHVFEAGSVIPLCGKANPKKVSWETERLPTCRSCKRRAARLTQPHPSQIVVNNSTLEGSDSTKLL